MPTAPVYPELKDDQVQLRLPEKRDVHSVFLYGQDRATQSSGWLPIRFPCSPDVAERVVAEFQEGWNGRFGLTYVIADAKSNEMLGVIMLHCHDGAVGQAFCGVAPEHRNRGIGTRAVKFIARWALQTQGLRRIEIRPTVHNVAAQRMAEKAGFLREGVVRTVDPVTGRGHLDVVYAMLPESAE